MKKSMFLILAVLALGALIAGLVSAQTTTTLTATLTGAAEVPGPGDTDGAGVVTVVVDTTANTACLTGSVTAVGFPITGLHIHDAPVGVAGDVVVSFGVTDDADGVFTDQCGPGEAAVIADIVANPAEYYVNVHNAEFPGGAVRGQLEVVAAGTETPGATATDGTPAATATEGTPAATPTETGTPFPGAELLTNGGFETELTGWNLANATGDKVKTNKDKTGDGDTNDPEDKIFSFEGNAAFRFKGGVGENSKLSQNVDVSTATTGAGDTVTLRGYAKTQNLVGNGNIKVKVKYVDTTVLPTVAKYNFVAGSAEYALFQADAVTFVGAAAQVKVQVKFKATSGKLSLDALSAKHIVSVGGTATATTDAATATTDPNVTATATTDATTAATATTDPNVTATATTDATTAATATTDASTATATATTDASTATATATIPAVLPLP